MHLLNTKGAEYIRTHMKGRYVTAEDMRLTFMDETDIVASTRNVENLLDQLYRNGEAKVIGTNPPGVLVYEIG